MGGKGGGGGGRLSLRGGWKKGGEGEEEEAAFASIGWYKLSPCAEKEKKKKRFCSTNATSI